MKEGRLPSPADVRRFDRLFWGPGGIYEDSRRRGWQGVLASFGSRRPWKFSALGHHWTLSLGGTFWSRSLELDIGLSPEKPLDEKETLRLQANGFYSDLSALFRRWGFNRVDPSHAGFMWCRRRASNLSEIARTRQIFDSLDVSGTPGTPTRGLSGTSQPRFEEFLRWMRRARSAGWRAGYVEFRNGFRRGAVGVRWKVRYDLVVGPTLGCSWFFAWPPPDFKKADWRRVERTGFFQRSTEELAKMGYKGYWRPGLFTDPDRLAAEFWKPTDDAAVARKDFTALLAQSATYLRFPSAAPQVSS
jgi:hypothetical protein